MRVMSLMAVAGLAGLLIGELVGLVFGLILLVVVLVLLDWKFVLSRGARSG